LLFIGSRYKIIIFLTLACKLHEQQRQWRVVDCAGVTFSKIGDYDVETSNVAHGQAVYLLSATAESLGVVFAYRARIVSTDAMLVLQLWRPLTSNQTDSDKRLFQLVDELYYSPTSTGLADVRIRF